MILLFNIEYRTNWGEEVRVSGSIPELGNEHPDKALPLQTIDGIHWTAEVNIAMPEDGLVRYSYHIFRDGIHVQSGTACPVRFTFPELPRKRTGYWIAGKTCRSSSISILPPLRNLFWHTANATPHPKDTRKGC
jgi:hypothetical protein